MSYSVTLLNHKYQALTVIFLSYITDNLNFIYYILTAIEGTRVNMDISMSHNATKKQNFKLIKTYTEYSKLFSLENLFDNKLYIKKCSLYRFIHNLFYGNTTKLRNIISIILHYML